MEKETRTILRPSDHDGVLVTGGRERERELSGDDDGDGVSHAHTKKPQYGEAHRG